MITAHNHLKIAVVTGLPSSGKTKLATRLHELWPRPLLCKDAYKERLFDSLGIGDRAWSRRLSLAAYDLMFAQAAALRECGISCILEGNFRADHLPRFTILNEASFVQIHCHAEAKVLAARFRERAHSGTRHPGHVDIESLAEITAEIESAPQTPLALAGPVIVCDTTNDWVVAIERAAIKAFALLR